MKRVFLSFLFFVLATAFLFGPVVVMASTKQRNLNKLQEAKTGFIENKGQIVDQNDKPNPAVLYLLNIPGMNVQLRKNGFSYDMYSVEYEPRPQNDTILALIPRRNRIPSDTLITIYHYDRIDFNLDGINSGFEIETTGTSADYLNYYTTGTPNTGIHLVRSYKSVTYKNIYPGIDLEFKSDTLSGFKYTFIVHPMGNITSIRLKIKGPEILLQAAGSLLLTNSIGSIEEEIPKTFFCSGNSNVPAISKFKKIAEDSFGIDVGGNIPVNSTINIDPIPRRIWATFYGGNGWEDSFVTLSLSDGDLIFSGSTTSTDNIATTGSFQSTFTGVTDVYFSKMTPLCQRLWGTYWGGVGNDSGEAWRTDNLGNIYVSGMTDSSANLATPGEFKTTLSGESNSFLGKFNASGFRIWATYYGGSGSTGQGHCAVDNNYNVYLCGTTSSTDSIATPGSEQSTYGGNTDAYLVKFDSSGQRLWGTYYGGTKQEWGQNCDVDAYNHVILCGTTNSQNNISTPFSFQPTLGNPSTYGLGDGFLVLFNSSGQRQWGTYYGGADWDNAMMCEIGPDQYLYLGGETESPNQIASPNGFQSQYNGDWDTFLAKFTLGGSRVWGTYYGGTNNENFGGFAVDDSSFVFLLGDTRSTDSIATPGTFQQNIIGTSYNLFLVKFDSLCNRIWGTYYGDTSNTGASNCLVTGDTIYCSGATSNSIRLVTPGSFQPLYGGGSDDALYIKFLDCNTPDTAHQITGLVSFCLPITHQTYSTLAISHATSYLWVPPPGAVIVSGQGTTSVNIDFETGAVSGWLAVQGMNSCGSGVSDSIYIHLHPRPMPPLTGDSLPCLDASKTYHTLAGKSQYLWNTSMGGTISGGGNTSDDFANVTWNAVGMQWISVNYTDTNNCSALNPTIHHVTVIVDSVKVAVSTSIINICAGNPVIFTAVPTNGGATPSYQWKVNGLNAGTNNPIYTYAPVNGDQVNCILNSSLTSCITNNPATSNTITMIVNPNLPVSVIITASENPVCAGTTVTFTATPTNGGTSPAYQWKVNGANTGTNNPIYSYLPNNGDVITCILTSNATCISGNPATSNSITMTVTMGLPAIITIAASSNPFCPGSPVTFSAAPINGGSGPTYQWKVNGVNAGTNSITFTYDPANNDSVSCVMHSNLSCVTGNPATSAKIIMSGTLAPIVIFTSCFDTITTVNAKPIILKGGIPLGGSYSGPGVNSSTSVFDPSATGVGTHTIVYSYTNANNCEQLLSDRS